jgi:hypothetical protein
VPQCRAEEREQDDADQHDQAGHGELVSQEPPHDQLPLGARLDRELTVDAALLGRGNARGTGLRVGQQLGTAV